MPIVSDGKPASPDECRIRVAAAGDIHCGREGDLERWSAAFGTLEGRVDVVLLAGDLTTHGEPEQAAIVAQAAGPLRVPVLTVLGNHDWHANRADEITAAPTQGAAPTRSRRRWPRAASRCSTATTASSRSAAPSSAWRASRDSSAASPARTS